MKETTVSTIMPAYFRAKSAARYLDIGLSTFWAYVKEGKIPNGIAISPNCRLWPVNYLDEFVARAADVPVCGGAKRGRKPRGAA